MPRHARHYYDGILFVTRQMAKRTKLTGSRKEGAGKVERERESLCGWRRVVNYANVEIMHIR